MHNEESSNTSTGDAADKFLKSERGSLKEGVKKLFNMAESIKETLQQASRDPGSIVHSRDDLNLNSMSFMYGGDSKEFSSLGFGFEMNKGANDSTEPVILLEGEQVSYMFLDYDPNGIMENGVASGKPEYKLTLQSYHDDHDNKDNEEGQLFYKFLFSNKGRWERNIRLIPSSFEGGREETTTQVTSYDLETIGMALSVLKSRVESILSPSDQSE